MALKQEQYRRLQILAVAAGVSSVSISLTGGVIENALLARAGIAGFVLALAAVISLGVLASRQS
ncbi:MAG: hypothetical protein KY475_22330 [Planctomycetes bacterium]|nr:hypothetical protein [Planctomycetota bacterium]